MVWSPSNIGGKTVDHAALLVEVHLDGVKNPVVMQLDTGCNSDLVYTASYDRLDDLPPRLGRKKIFLSGTVAGSRIDRESFYCRTESGVSWFTQFLESAAQQFYLFTGKPILIGTIG